jgi:flagellar hook-length control protein FliK
MTPNTISPSPIATTPSPAAMPPGDPAGFASLLEGFEAQNMPAPAGSVLPGVRQAVADLLARGTGESETPGATGIADPELPTLDAVLATGGDVPVVAGGAQPITGPKFLEAELPPGLARRLGEIAVPGKGKASRQDRPLPMPLRADALDAPAELPVGDAIDGGADAQPPKARDRDLRPDPGFAAEAELARRNPEARIIVAARVAETPAVAHATARLDPVRVPGAPAEAEVDMPVDASPPPASPEPPVSTAEPTIEASQDATEPAEIAPSPAEDGAPAPHPSAARGRDAERLTGLARAFERSGQPRLDPARGEAEPPRPEPRPDASPAGRPFEALAALAAGVAPPRSLPAALAERTPAAPAAFDVAPATGSAPGFGFHPATPVQVRAPDFAAAPGPVVDTARADWMQSMIERIGEIRHENGTREAQIRLAPDILGVVEIRIERRDERMHVTMSADNPQARAMLGEAAPKLQEMAEARGLRLTQSSVDAGASHQNPQRRQGGDGATLPEAPARAGAETPSTDRSDDRIA